MRKALFLAVLITLAATVTAQAAADKIAVFNSRFVAANSEPVTNAIKKIENQYRPEQQKLENQAKALQKQADELQNQRAAMSREAMAEKSEAFMRAKRNFEDASQALARKIEAARFRVEQEFAGRLVQAAQSYGMSKNYAVIIDAAASGVIYSDKSVDVTEDLVKEVARAYKENKPLPGQQK